MARQKLMNKARGKQSYLDLSQSDESFQAKSDRPLPRRNKAKQRGRGKPHIPNLPCHIGRSPRLPYQIKGNPMMAEVLRVREVVPNQTRKLSFW
nr:hypothetical protein CFP56_32866 [Quercus suber]